MESQLQTERRDDGIVTLWLSSPGRDVVVIDSRLLDQMHLFFDRLESEESPTGFILMSASQRVFAAGADLAEIDQLSDEQLHAYLTEGAEAFARISALQCPTVATINGAALGGGLELALHCDGLVAAHPSDRERSYRIGLPEAGLGLCPGWGGTQMLAARIDPTMAIRMMATGETVKLDDVPAGLFDRIVDNEVDLYETAVSWIEHHAGPHAQTTPRCIDASNRGAVADALAEVRGELPDTAAAHAVVEAVEIGVSEGWIAATAAERRLLVSLRHTETARTRLEAFLAKSG